MKLPELHLVLEIGAKELCCRMADPRSHGELPSWISFARDVLCRYLQHWNTTAVVLTPEKYDWIGEYCGSRAIPYVEESMPGRFVRLTIRPTGAPQRAELIGDLLADGIWTYDGAVTLVFTAPEPCDSDSGVVKITPMMDGKGLCCLGPLKEREKLSEAIVSVATALGIEQHIRYEG